MPRPGEPLAAFPFETLRRTPDIEAPGLVAVDAADRLILDESASARADAAADEIVVIGDAYVDRTVTEDEMKQALDQVLV